MSNDEIEEGDDQISDFIFDTDDEEFNENVSDQLARLDLDKIDEEEKSDID
ncbi:MAG: hypothetical protein Q7R33_00760 [Nitrosarchaeum sp.]|nr:hypothetical protein [Nitrosarchaeum sp.]